MARIHASQSPEIGSKRGSWGMTWNICLYRSGDIQRLLRLWILFRNCKTFSGSIGYSESLATRVVHSADTWRKMRRIS